ncbi:CIC11C00000005827 [Sungouiella intermedia]|uniref:CIC11C00000005827 n=1 Tax=Sungouiella intermedia TaxID=45354 RepID=A0A1L0DCI4_9ASCO|nr:CIC11C00000005827 [[Candida] intermedia]
MLALGRSMFGSLKPGIMFQQRPSTQPVFSSLLNTVLKRYKHEYAPRYKRVRKAFKVESPSEPEAPSKVTRWNLAK